jgi:hypothetical protein
MNKAIIFLYVFSIIYLSHFHTGNSIVEASYPKSESSEKYDEFEDEIEIV